MRGEIGLDEPLGAVVGAHRGGVGGEFFGVARGFRGGGFRSAQDEGLGGGFIREAVAVGHAVILPYPCTASSADRWRSVPQGLPKGGTRRYGAATVPVG